MAHYQSEFCVSLLYMRVNWDTCHVNKGLVGGGLSMQLKLIHHLHSLGWRASFMNQTQIYSDVILYAQICAALMNKGRSIGRIGFVSSVVGQQVGQD